MGCTCVISTLRLPNTVLRSAGEWPRASAEGVSTRRYSAGSSKRAPLSKAIVSRRLSDDSRISVGQYSAGMDILASRFDPGRGSLTLAWLNDARPRAFGNPESAFDT